MAVNSFKDLRVWQKAVVLVSEVYTIAKQLPESEKFVLVPQIIRSAISVPANIAEGWARNHKAEFLRFLGIAFASATELETHLIISKAQYPSVNYLKAEELVVEIQKMLSKLISNTKTSERHW